MRGGETGDVAARNGLAIEDLDRTAADLAAAAAERQHKDAMVSCDGGQDGDGRKGADGWGSAVVWRKSGLNPISQRPI